MRMVVGRGGRDMLVEHRVVQRGMGSVARVCIGC